MSRIGKLPITIPANVTISIHGSVLSVKGPLGELTQTMPSKAIMVYNDAEKQLEISVAHPEEKASVRFGG